MGLSPMHEIQRVPPKPKWDYAFVWAMWLIYCRAPSKPNADLDGCFDLGEIGDAPEKSWTRVTPYSTARLD
jgi:hypothetical protein